MDRVGEDLGEDYFWWIMVLRYFFGGIGEGWDFYVGGFGYIGEILEGCSFYGVGLVRYRSDMLFM